MDGVYRSITDYVKYLFIVFVALLSFPANSIAQEFTAKSVGSYGSIAVMEVTGNYDANNPDAGITAIPRRIIANEFYKIYKDEYDFIVIFSNFDFLMPKPQALAFYHGVKNDTKGIGVPLFDNTALYGSNAKLQGMVDMGNTVALVSDPLSPKFENSLGTLSHELMHRWSAFVKFKGFDGDPSSALLGEDGMHWSFLLDSRGSLMYGNQWQDNGNGTFTSISMRKNYSPLDLYLMGFIDKAQVPPIMLIENSDVNPARMPELGATITGTARHITIDEIIALEGERIPASADSQKTFKIAFILVTRPGTFSGNELTGIEVMRQEWLKRYSILTDGIGLIDVDLKSKEDIPIGGGYPDPVVTPRPLPPNIEDGVQWLMASQKTEGNWMDLSRTTVRDTTETLQALKNFSVAQHNYSRGLQWLSGNNLTVTDYLARKIETLKLSGQDVAALLADLVSRQNSDGGWGSNKTYMSNPMDTSFALRALSATGYADQSIVTPAIAYLKSTQNGDGGWGNEEGSNIESTANVLGAFNKYRQQYVLEDPIKNALAFLNARQNGDGGFGNSPSTVYDTAMAVIALQDIKGLTSGIQQGVNFILGLQSGDGSWYGSAHQTAMAVSAVWNATVTPDLAIDPQDITFTPNTITGLPASITVNAKITNLGRTDVPQVKVVLYDSVVSEATKVGEQLVAFPGQSAVSISFPIIIRDGNAHKFYISIDPDNVVAESNKVNNVAVNMISPATTYDFETLSSDISFSQNPVDITKDVTISSKISNKGIMNTYNVQVKYYIDDPAGRIDIATATVDIPANAVIASQVVWKTGKAGSNLPVAIEVDPNNAFTEISKTNNKAIAGLTVNGSTQPNLTASFKDIIITPAVINQQGSVNIKATIRNEGFAPVSTVKVDFYLGVPGVDGVLIGSQTILSLAAGLSAQVSLDWLSIPVSGEKILYVRVDPDNFLPEITKEDNDAFTTITILSIPDLAISANSITFDPSAPKDGDTVAINIIVKNLGRQAANNVTVRASESDTVIGSQAISVIAGNSQGTATVSFNTTGKPGAHEITVAVDPDNLIVERSKDNNIAMRAFGVQDANLWVTEKYISPNGDGIKDSTDFFFRLSLTQSVKINVINERGEVVRTFNDDTLSNISGGNISWNGFNDNGMVVADGEYQITIVDAGSNNIGSLVVTVDNNQSPLVKAIGTKYLLKNNLTCMLPDITDWQWFPDESGMLIQINNANPDAPEYTAGLYTVSPDGQDILRIVPWEWSDQDAKYSYSIDKEISPDGNQVLVVLKKWEKFDWYSTLVLSQLWVVDKDGRNLRLLDSYDSSVNKWIERGGWLPDSKQLAYSVSSELWLIKSDGADKVKIDSTAGGGLGYHKWSPDGKKMIYEYITYDETGSWDCRLELINTAGGKRVLTLGNDVGEYGFEWLGNEKIIVKSNLYSDFNQYLWLVDSTGIGNHIKLSDNLRSFEINPGKTKALFIEDSPDHTFLKIVDANGDISPVYETRKYQPTASIVSVRENTSPVSRVQKDVAVPANQSMSASWSPDGTKIALYDNTYELIDECHAVQYLVVIDLKTNSQKAYPSSTCVNTCDTNLGYQSDGKTRVASAKRDLLNDKNANSQTDPVNGNFRNGYIACVVVVDPSCAHDGANGLRWLSDNVSLLSSNGDGLFALNSDDGTKVYLPVPSEATLSPFGRYFTYGQYVDDTSICHGRGYQDIWAMSSLLNLTADLFVKKEKSAVVLRGTAADLHFEGYKLEYADAQNPTVWKLVKPPSDVSVINDVLTTWVPPSEGVFYVKLTVWDKAGNVKWDRKRVTWGLSASISNLYKTIDLMSPNGDGMKDTVELHYTVLEPVNLEFNIYDANNNVVRMYAKSHASTGEDFIAWDGRDSNGQTVPDGKYRIQVFDYDFFVTVDNTAPNTNIELSLIKQQCLTRPDEISPEDCSLYVDMHGLAYDVNLGGWIAEYGAGDNPPEWFEYLKGESVLAAADEGGNILSPLQMTKIATITGNDIAWFIGKKIRLAASDYAANRSTAVSSQLEERVILFKWDDKNLSLKESSARTAFLPANLIRTGVHDLSVLLTVRTPIVGMCVQYWNGHQWIDGPQNNNPPAGYTNIQWNNADINPDDIIAVRVGAMDETGNEHYSSIFYVRPTLALTASCNGNAFAHNYTLQKLSRLALQIISTDDTNYLEWTDWVVYETAGGNSVPEGEFQFIDALSDSNRVKPGKSYTFRMLVTESGENPQNYEPVTLAYPPKCMQMGLFIDYPEALQCNALSGTADLRIELKKGMYETANQYVSLDYSLRDAKGSQLLRHIDLSKNQNMSIRIDTTQIPEGRYTAEAKLKYVDLNNNLQTIEADAALVVDRTLPIAAITYPTDSTTVCPVKKANAGGDRFEIPIEGIAADATGIRDYAFYYGIGENLEAPRQADVTDIKKAQVHGKMGDWNVTNLSGADYNLRLKVVDTVGNTSCHAAKLTVDKRIEIHLFSDKYLFSPNGDGVLDDVTVNYDISEYAKVDAKVYRLLEQSDHTYVLDQAPIKTIAAGMTHIGGAGYLTWDGTTDAGPAAADDIYGITLLATDSCGNANTKWIPVRVDNTPPATVVKYPRPPDVLGNVVEVRGTADDLHFQSYVIEAGQGQNPESFAYVASGASAVKEETILGKWNTFGLEGAWTLRLTGKDVVGNEQATTVTINLGQRKNLVKDIGLLPTLFSPNNDGKLDTTIVKYELTDACQIKIEILDSDNVVRKTYTDTTPTQGSCTYVWDGKNDAGVVVPDGVYKLLLTAALSTNTAITQTEAATVTVDVTTPTIDIKQPLNDSYLKVGSLSVFGTVSDKNIKEYATVYSGDNGNVSLDAGNQNRENYIFSALTEIPEGKYTLNVKAKDNAENIKDSNIVFTIDTTSPQVILDKPKTGEYYGSDKNTINIAGSIIEKNLDYFKLRYGPGDNPAQWIDLQTANTVPTNPQLYTWRVGKNDGVADGVYTMSLYAKDKADWTGEAKVKIIIDNTSPDVSLTSLKNGDYVKAALDIKGTAFDVNLDNYLLEMSEDQCSTAFKWVSFKKSAASVTNGSLAMWQTIPVDGDYCIRLTASDKIGLKAEAKVQVKVDATPPLPTTLSGKVENKTDASFSWIKNTEADLAGYNLFRDDRKVNAEILTASTFADTALKEGTYKYTVKSIDLAGNESKPSNEIVLKVDITPPTVRIGSPVDGARVSSLLDIKGTAFSQDDFTQYRVSVGRGAAPDSWTLIRTSPLPEMFGSLAQWDTISSPDGVYAIKLEAEDISGNAGTYQISVNVDNTPPSATVFLTAVPNGSSVTLTWQASAASDLAGYLLYRNDQLANVAGVAVGNLKPYLITGTTYVDKILPDGKMKYYVVAMDQAGNAGDQSNMLEVTIDTHPPHITITEPLNLVKFQNKTLLRGESPDLDIANVQYQYKKTTDATWHTLGGAIIKIPFVTYIDPVALGLTYGDYNVRAVATDKGGNVDPSPAFITLKYTDLAAPAAPADLKAPVNGADVSLLWKANQEIDLNGYNIYRATGSGAKTKLNTTIIKDAAYQDKGLADAFYAYVVTALDTLGNESEPSGIVAVKIYAPKLSQPYTPSGQRAISMSGTDGGAGNSLELFVDSGTGPVSQGTVTVDGVGAFSVPVLNLTSGENKITAAAKDAAGNISKVSESVYVVFNEPPAMPTGFGAAVQGHEVNLTWNPNAEADLSGYNLYRNGVKVNKALPVTSGNATASSSDYFNVSDRAFDGNTTTYWHTYSRTSPESQAWWEVALPSIELINRLEIYWHSYTDDYGAEIIYGGRNFEIQVWSGHVWITHDRVTGNTARQNLFEFSPSYRTDRIRIHITDAHDPSSVGLVEVKVSKDNVISQTNYTDLNVSDGRYKYKLTAVDYYGFESVPTEEKQTAVGDVILPDAPLNLTTSVSGSNIVSNWDANTDQDLAGYAAYRNNGPAWIRLNPAALATANTYTDAGLANGSYLYRVTAFDAVGNESLPSNESQAMVNIDPPQPPVSLSISVIARGGALSATWTYSGQAPAGCNLYRATTSGGPYIKVNSAFIGTNTFLDENLTNGATYYYVVTAVDALGNESAYSNEAVGTPQDGEVPLTPNIYSPTISCVPVTLYQNITDITGNAEPGSTVELFRNELSWGKVTALNQTFTRKILLENVADVAVSPDGAMLTYDQNNYVWLKNIADNTLKQIGEGYTRASWAPDSVRFAYRNYDSRYQMYNIKTGISSALTHDENVYEENLSWSSDAGKIVFVSGNYEWNAWVKDLTSGELKQVTFSGNVYNAKISPDGTRIAYFENYDLYVVNAGSLQTIKIDSDAREDWISWSPDSKKITYVSTKNTPNNILVADVETNQIIKTINSPDNESSPIWAPDGQSIIFMQKNSGAGYTASEARLNSEQINSLASNIGDNFAYIDCLRSGDIAYYDQNQLNMITRKGQFSFKDAALKEGINIFYVKAADAFENISAPSDAINVFCNTSTMPDLEMTADDIAVYPPYPKPGERVSIYVSPRNVGAVDAENVTIAIYMLTNGKWTLLKYEPVPLIVAGASQPIHLEWSSMTATGLNTFFAAIDPEDAIREISEDNNTAFKDIVVMERSGVEMTTKLDAGQYGSDQDVRINVNVRNSGEGLSALLTVAVEDIDGGLAATLVPVNIQMDYASDKNISFVWNTASSFSGQYHVRAVLKSGQTAMAENIVAFKITPEMKVDPVTLTTDKTIYLSNENTEMSVNITNASTNVIIPELTATVRITDAGAAVIFADEKKIATLLAGATCNVKSLWNTAASLPGIYLVTLEVFVEKNLVATRTAQFSIDLIGRVTGSIAAAPTSVLYGSDARFDYTVKNTGNMDLSGLPLLLTIIDPGLQDVLSSVEAAVDLPIHAEKTGSFIIATQGYKLTTYVAVLQSVHQGNVRKIADASFVVRDGLSPVLSLLTPIAGTVCKSAIDIAVTVVDDLSGVARVEYQIDAGEWKYLPVADAATGRYSVVWNPVKADEGAHTISFRAIDQALNMSIPVSTNIIINLTPVMAPVINSPANNATVVIDTINIMGVSEPGYTVNMEFQGNASMAQGDVTSGAITFAGIRLTPGSNNFKFFAKDQTGNTSDVVQYALIYLPLKTTLAVDKPAYSIKEDVNIAARMSNISTAYPLGNLTAKLSLLGSGGQTIFNEEQPIAALAPGASLDLKRIWNTVVNSRGSYSVKLQMFDGNNLLSTDVTTFEILSTTVTGDGLAGTVAASPAQVFIGNNEAISYSVSNGGNEDIMAMTVKTLILNSATQTQVAEFTDQQSITKDSAVAGINNFLTSSLIPGFYSAVLMVVTPSMAMPKKLAFAEFEIKGGVEMTKTINTATHNLLTWVNDKCLRGISRNEANCVKPRPDQTCVRLDLLEKILKDSEANYHIVYDRDDFTAALRNPFYTDFIIFGDHEPLTGHHAAELREQIYAGKGMIFSLYFKDRLHDHDDHDSIFGYTYRGHLPGTTHTVNIPAGSLFDAATFEAEGEALKVEAEKPESVQAWIKWQHRYECNPLPGEYPGIIAKPYGLGKTVFFAFDYNASLTDDNYATLAMLLKKAVTYIHDATVPGVYPSQKYVPVRIGLKNLGEAVDLRLTERYPAGIDIYDPETGQWMTDRPWIFDVNIPKGEGRTIDYFAFTPAVTGVYELQTDVDMSENGNYHFYKSLSVNVNVKETAANLEADVVNALNALQPTSMADKKRIRSAVSLIKTVRARKVNSKHDAEKNIMDIVSAVEKLIDVRTIDIVSIRLMLDELLQIWEAKYQTY